jgi:hypothetical protein
MAKSDHETAQKNDSKVTPSQLLAIDVLLAGGTDSEAAKAASVTRETVCRWRHSDADFIATLNRERLAVSEATADSLRRASLKAIAALSGILSEEDRSLQIKAASILLAQRCDVQAPGDTDAEEIRTKWSEDRGRRSQRHLLSQIG